MLVFLIKTNYKCIISIFGACFHLLLVLSVASGCFRTPGYSVERPGDEPRLDLRDLLFGEDPLVLAGRHRHAQPGVRPWKESKGRGMERESNPEFPKVPNEKVLSLNAIRLEAIASRVEAIATQETKVPKCSQSRGPMEHFGRALMIQCFGASVFSPKIGQGKPLKVHFEAKASFSLRVPEFLRGTLPSTALAKQPSTPIPE